MDLAIFPVSLVGVWFIQHFVGYYTLPIAGNKYNNDAGCCNNSLSFG